MFIRRRVVEKYAAAMALLSILYCEWFVYEIRPYFWPVLECEHDGNCTKIMFIADPQIQGENEVPAPLNWIFAWDSDRYLRNTFHVAARKFEPHVMVYLGDLMDEGSIATMPQFYRYAKRLYNIFGTTIDQIYGSKNVTQVWIPGDNDIGGENEPIERDKVREFEKVYHQPSVVKRGNVSFYKVNAITHELPKIDQEKNASRDVYKIVVSHYPVTNRPVFSRQVDAAINPNVYFCAHDHGSKYSRSNVQVNGMSDREVFPIRDEVLNVPDRDDTNIDIVTEIYVPTCSYRMGTDDIGYGIAIINHDRNDLDYVVLWSPRRFPCLFTYLAILSIVVAYCLTYSGSKLLRYLISKLNPPKSWSHDTVPLIS